MKPWDSLQNGSFEHTEKKNLEFINFLNAQLIFLLVSDIKQINF